MQLGLHRPVEVGPLFRIEVPNLQRLQIKPQRGDRRLQFVRDTVDKVRLPLVKTHLFNHHEQVDDQADQNQSEDNSADRQNAPRSAASQQDDPADHQRHVERHQNHAERDRQTQRARLANVAVFGIGLRHQESGRSDEPACWQ